MASIQGKVFFNEEALTASSTSPVLQTDARDIDFVGNLKVTNININTSVEAIIEHSADNVDWFELIEFEDVEGEDCSEIVHVNSTSTHVLNYIRARVVLSGSTREATVSVKLFNGRN